MAITLELQEKHEAGVDIRREEIGDQKCFFLVRLDRCNNCAFMEETRTEINSSFNCEDCIQKILDKSGFNVTVKHLDTSQYRIISKGQHIRNENDEMKNENKVKKKPDSEKIKTYQAWIIDQIISGNHKLINAAQNDSLFSVAIKTAFVDVAFKNLEKQNIIRRDGITGNYYLVDKKSNIEEKETSWNYYVSYPRLIDNNSTQYTNKKFKTLEDALDFVKVHNLMNYFIQRREQSTLSI